MTGPLTGIAKRRVSAQLDDLLQVEPVIALHGPRSVGKSTVLSALAEARGVPVLDLDDLGTRDAVSANPQTAVSTPGLLCVDEYQHAPQILDALKARLNREGTLPGHQARHPRSDRSGGVRPSTRSVRRRRTPQAGLVAG